TSMASARLSLMSSLLCLLKAALNFSPWISCICLMIVLLPDSPAPSKSNRWVLTYSSLSFRICLSISSLCCLLPDSSASVGYTQGKNGNKQPQFVPLFVILHGPAY